MPEIITRRAAIEAGRWRYFTGEACKHGHLSERFTTSGGCCECNNVRSALLRAEIRAKREAIAKAGAA